MSREIKFRAWDKLNNRMLAVLGIDWEKGEVHNGGIAHWLKDVELMQYTGLKDKNGKEIYEGDVVQIFTKEAGEKAYRAVVEFPCDLVGIEDSEVIGNVWENPELLTNQN